MMSLLKKLHDVKFVDVRCQKVCSHCDTEGLSTETHILVALGVIATCLNQKPDRQSLLVFISGLTKGGYLCSFCYIWYGLTQ